MGLRRAAKQGRLRGQQPVVARLGREHASAARAGSLRCAACADLEQPPAPSDRGCPADCAGDVVPLPSQRPCLLELARLAGWDGAVRLRRRRARCRGTEARRPAGGRDAFLFPGRASADDGAADREQPVLVGRARRRRPRHLGAAAAAGTAFTSPARQVSANRSHENLRYVDAVRRRGKMVWSYLYTGVPGTPGFRAVEPLSNPRMYLLWNALEGTDGILYGQGTTNYTAAASRSTASSAAASSSCSIQGGPRRFRARGWSRSATGWRTPRSSRWCGGRAARRRSAAFSAPAASSARAPAASSLRAASAARSSGPTPTHGPCGRTCEHAGANRRRQGNGAKARGPVRRRGQLTHGHRPTQLAA